MEHDVRAHHPPCCTPYWKRTANIIRSSRLGHGVGIDGGDIRWKRVCMGGAMVRWLSAAQNLCLTVFVAPSSKFSTRFVLIFLDPRQLLIIGDVAGSALACHQQPKLDKLTAIPPPSPPWPSYVYERTMSTVLPLSRSLCIAKGAITAQCWKFETGKAEGGDDANQLASGR